MQLQLPGNLNAVSGNLSSSKEHKAGLQGEEEQG